MARPPADAQYESLVGAQAATRERLSAQAVALAQRSTARFTGWYDAAAITAWAAALAAQIEGVQRAIAQLTDAYLARALSLMTGTTWRPIGRVDVSALRAGVTHPGAYARSADVFRWQQSRFDAIAKDLARGGPALAPDFIDPIEAAVQRAVAVADLDVQLAARAQSQAVMTAAADAGVVTGYRRVIHPELSRGGTCGLCVAASDRLYGAHEPLPIHDRCHCTTLPVLDATDPGSALNRSDLTKLYRLAGGTGREKLTDVRYRVDEHGELGPFLTPEGQAPRVVRRRERAAARDRAAKTPQEVETDLIRIRNQLQDALPKAQDLAAGDAATWGTYLTKLEARIEDLDHQLAAL